MLILSDFLGQDEYSASPSCNSALAKPVACVEGLCLRRLRRAEFGVRGKLEVPILNQIDFSFGAAGFALAGSADSVNDKFVSSHSELLFFSHGITDLGQFFTMKFK